MLISSIFSFISKVANPTDSSVGKNDITHTSYDYNADLKSLADGNETRLEICNVKGSKKKDPECIAYEEKISQENLAIANAKKKTDDIITARFASLVSECRNGIGGKL